MIHETEIRIGNYFEHDCAWSYRNEGIGPTFNFKWDRRDWYALGECTIDIQYINPIPLTSEILEKTGFENLNTDYAGSYLKKNILIEITPFGITYARLKFDYENSLLINELKYVHELQNLWFIFHSEELNIQL